MNNLAPRMSGLHLTSLERQTGQALESIRAGQAVASAREVAKLEVIAEVTEAALLATSHVSALESLLVARTPHAEGRLRHIADVGALSMADVVLKAHRRVA